MKINNREIKFRGKRVDNGEWVYGYYVHNGSYGERDGHLIYEENTSNIWSVVPETVGQFINRFDINGEEIFEGDKIEYEFCAYMGDEVEKKTVMIGKDITLENVGLVFNEYYCRNHKIIEQ